MFVLIIHVENKLTRQYHNNKTQNNVHIDADDDVEDTTIHDYY